MKTIDTFVRPYVIRIYLILRQMNAVVKKNHHLCHFPVFHKKLDEDSLKMRVNWRNK
jgi:hypothetical protein